MATNQKNEGRRFGFSHKQGRILDHQIQRERSEMKSRIFSRISIGVITLALLSLAQAFPAPPAPEPNIGINGYFSTDRVPRGHLVQVAIVLDIPAGYHVNGNRPLNKYAIPTKITIEGPRGVLIGPVSYPRAVVRKLKATNNESLAVYEGRAIMRFNVTVPGGFQGGSADLKAHVRYQSCNDDVCFPPKTQELNMSIGVVGGSDRVQRVNGWAFGGRR
jgi:DsbC/DsbD-like thiol-disulfide interchange protein